MLNEKINKEAQPQIFKIGDKIYYAWYIGEEYGEVYYKTADNEVICFRKGEIKLAEVLGGKEDHRGAVGEIGIKGPEPEKKTRKKKA